MNQQYQYKNYNEQIEGGSQRSPFNQIPDNIQYNQHQYQNPAQGNINYSGSKQNQQNFKSRVQQSRFQNQAVRNQTYGLEQSLGNIDKNNSKYLDLIDPKSSSNHQKMESPKFKVMTISNKKKNEQIQYQNTNQQIQINQNGNQIKGREPLISPTINSWGVGGASDDDFGNLDEGYDHPMPVKQEFTNQSAHQQFQNQNTQQQIHKKSSQLQNSNIFNHQKDSNRNNPNQGNPAKNSGLNQSYQRQNQQNIQMNQNVKPQEFEKYQNEIKILVQEQQHREQQRISDKRMQEKMMRQPQSQNSRFDEFLSDNFGEDFGGIENEPSIQQHENSIQHNNLQNSKAKINMSVQNINMSRQYQKQEAEPHSIIRIEQPIIQINHYNQIQEKKASNQQNSFQIQNQSNQDKKSEKMMHMDNNKNSFQQNSLISSKAQNISNGSKQLKQDMQDYEIYKELYHKIMQTIDPSEKSHRLETQKLSTFEIYKEGWNKIQDKADKNYQRKLKEMNYQIQKRMDELSKNNQIKKELYEIEQKQKEEQKQMEECTFSPRIHVSNLRKQYDRKVSNRSGKAFYQAQEIFVAKKNMQIENMKKERELDLKMKQSSDLMSKGSKQIIREGSKHGLSKSASQHSFLQRNFYRQKGKRADSRITDKSNMTSRLKSQKSRRDLSKLNDYVRDISGSKISFLNQTSRYGENGKRLFSPQINEKSKLMSPRVRESTFHMLHQQAINQHNKQMLNEFLAEKTAQIVANEGVLKNVNEKSDDYLCKQFYKEFCEVVHQQLEQNDQIFLVDVLDKLRFINVQKIMNQSAKLSTLIKSQRSNLLFDSDSNEFNGEAEDITKNLFKVCCAIMNLRPKQKGNNYLDENTLKFYLDELRENEENKAERETLIIEQLQIIRSLVARPSFSLNEVQIFQINKKFQNLSLNRKEYLFNNHKKQKIIKIKKETKPIFQPYINPRSKEMDENMANDFNGREVSPYDPKVQKQSRLEKSLKRSEMMYQYAEKYEQHRQNLRDFYKSKEETYKFEPKLNQKSLKIANETHKNFSDRTMDLYINKHKREDKDPMVIEFENQKDHCTFQPLSKKSNKSKSKKRVVQKIDKCISPINILRHKESKSTQIYKKLTPTINKDIQTSLQNDDTPKKDFQQQHSEEITPRIMEPESDQNKEPSFKEDAISEIEKQSYPISPALEEEKSLHKQQEQQAEALKNKIENLERNKKVEAQHQMKQPSSGYHFMGRNNSRPMQSYLQVVEEPICVLKIELDGEHIEEIKVFENDDPNEIVQKFGNDFNLSKNARQRLLEQIQEQIQMDDDDE